MSNSTTHIYLEMTPNPNTMKFVANYLLVSEGSSLEFTSSSQAINSPLANQLFEQFSWIQGVFFSSNYITLTKPTDTQWSEVQSEARNFILEALKNSTEIGEVKSAESISKTTDGINQADEHLEAKIKGLLDEYIRPAVEQDGGAISFHSFDQGVVKVILQGSCSGCPSSTVTLKSGIEALLKRAMPEIESVEALAG